MYKRNALGGEVEQFGRGGGEVEPSGGEVSPAPPSLDETLRGHVVIFPRMSCYNICAC